MLDLNRPRYTSLIAADNKVFYAFDGLLAFAAKDKYQPLMQAKINREGVLADEAAFRKLLGINELEKTAEGQKEAELVMRKEFGNGPLVCTTGHFRRLYVYPTKTWNCLLRLAKVITNAIQRLTS